MKRINKGVSPAWFENWKTQFKMNNGREPRYKGDFSSEDSNDIPSKQRRNTLKKSLIEEQGGICCYCMRHINNNMAHIEHFWPKGVDKFLHLDLEYVNLFASCEGKKLLDSNANFLIDWDEFCGHKKDNWYDENMIIPTDYRIEDMFTYLDNGDICATSGRTTFYIADQMIKALGLDSYYLNRNRQEAIEAMYEELDETLLDDQMYIRDMIDYYDNKINGEYVPYCGALVSCLRRLLDVA